MAAEVQLYVVSSIFILTFYVPLAGVTIVILSIFGFVVATGVVAFNNNYWAFIFIRSNDGEQMRGLYNLLFFRGIPYLVGVILGYLLYKSTALMIYLLEGPLNR